MEVYSRIGTMDGRVLWKTCGCNQKSSILTEVEAVITSHPLVYIDDDI